MRTEREPRGRRYWVAATMVVLGILLGVWHNYASGRSSQDPVVGAVRGTVGPPATLLGRVSRWFSDQTGWIFHGRALAEENQRLKARVADLEGENAKLREAQTNWDRLRNDLGFVRNDRGTKLAADVIARRPDPKFDTLILSRGSRDGAKINSVVLTRNGVVGRVYEVTPGTASVLLLTDQNSGVGARVQRAESRATGVCKGRHDAFLSLVYLPGDADIKPGDVIVTSGLGGIFPPGLMIGTVMEVTPEVGNINKTARVRPQVDFDRLEEVYIVP